jgi:aromatic-L-amino-acid/L-tryptophan decarboxylase
MEGLDPDDWSAMRALGHRMLDDMIDHLRTVRERPVWQPMPAALRGELRAKLPETAEAPESIYEEFQRLVLPYATGNTHPRFMGWVHGGGNAMGVLAEMLAAGLNANLGGRNHAPVEVERQVVAWAAEMVGMPPETSGLLVTGSSMANLIAVLVARRAALGPSVRTRGIAGARLAAYASTAAHGCIPRAFDVAGLGSDSLRLIPVDEAGRMCLPALVDAVARDRAEGFTPFLVAGTAGSVDVGAVDDLTGIAAFCAEQGLWFHVDGAFGALAALSPRYQGLLAGIERADSLAFDFHKWAQVPYDAGCVLVRDPSAQLATFAQTLNYLRREERGLAGGDIWPCDLGPDLSRGFRALKVWMTLKAYGRPGLAGVVESCCDVARHLEARVRAEPALELLAPATLNIVCFRVRADAEESDRFNREIVADLQESGIAAPSTTVLNGRLAIRAAIVNHRARREDADMLVDGVLAMARARRGEG